MSSLSCLPPSNSHWRTQRASARLKTDGARWFVEVCRRCSHRGPLHAAPEAGMPAGSDTPPAEQVDHQSAEKMKKGSEWRGCSGCIRCAKDGKNHRHQLCLLQVFQQVHQLLINWKILYVVNIARACVQVPPVIKSRFSFFSKVYQMFHFHINKKPKSFHGFTMTLCIYSFPTFKNIIY